MLILAQTMTAGTTEVVGPAIGLDAKLISIIVLLGLLVKYVKQALETGKALVAIVKGVEAGADKLPPDQREKFKEPLKDTIKKSGVFDIVDPVVQREIHSGEAAKPHTKEFQVPKLVLTLACILMLTGCMNAKINVAAQKLKKDFEVYAGATVPHPSYTPEAQEKIKTLRSEIYKTIETLEEVSR